MTTQEADRPLIGTERQHYFEGKFMSARDFRDEQHYFCLLYTSRCV